MFGPIHLLEVEVRQDFLASSILSSRHLRQVLRKQRAITDFGDQINLTIMEFSAGLMATCIRAIGAKGRCKGTESTPTACTARTPETGNPPNSSCASVSFAEARCDPRPLPIRV